MNQLIKLYGSLRLVAEAYWHGKLTKAQEKIFEDATPVETRIAYQPTTAPGLPTAEWCASALAYLDRIDKGVNLAYKK